MEITLMGDVAGIEAGVAVDDRRLPDVVRPVQTHSCNVGVIKTLPAGEYPDTDALITTVPRLRIGVRTADCVPVLLYAPDIRAVAAIHAGWKGTLGGIVDETIGRLTEMGADVTRLRAGFGPSICGECYEVSEELAGRFREAGYGDCIIGERNVDLEAVNRRRLTDAGVPAANIAPKPCCTLETLTLPSWRRNATTLRLLTWISL